MKRKPWEPEELFAEYEAGRNYKAGLGRHGLYEQGKINERFYVGDQWYGARCGSERPLVRHNVIKRIGDYKMAVVAANPVTVNYTAEGIPEPAALRDRVRRQRAVLAGAPDAGEAWESSWTQAHGGSGQEWADGSPVPETDKTALVMSALTDYFKVTAERIKLDDLKEQALRNAYISGTGVLYTYWDAGVRTGLYADDAHTAPITGDVACEVLDIENVYFGDPTLYDVQAQPYILLAQRKSVEELRRQARRNGRPEAEILAIRPDMDTGYMAGDRAEEEPADSGKATVLTKLWKEWDKDGACRIMACTAVQGATIRPRWDTRLRLYPLAAFRWERRRNCAYGESEITYLIPNQIAINRMLTANVWAVMMLGMPLTLVNRDVVQQRITNDPGQIIELNGNAEDMAAAVRYVNPPSFSPSFENNIASLISNTLTQSGANDAALGDIRPDNTSAIVAVREAATMPMQTVQNRFYSFIEDVARIWADMWVTMYGQRPLKIEDENGVWYLPFDGETYKDLLINVKIDVGASTLWSEIQSTQTLDNLLDRQVITPLQYLKRVPKGTVPDVNGLIRELQEAQRAQQVQQAQSAEAGMGAPGGGVDMQAVVDGLPEEYRQVFESLPPGQQTALLERIGGMAG